MASPCLVYVLIFGIPAILITVYWYFTRNFNCFTKRGIAGPKPVVGIGNLWELMFTPVADIELQRYRKYGNRPVLKIGDPALVKEIFLREFDVFPSRRAVSNARHPIVDLIMGLRGEEWRRMRSTMSPNTGTQLRALYPLIRQSLDQFFVVLDSLVTQTGGEGLDVKALFECYGIDVLARTLFDTNTNAYSDPNDPFLVNARRLFRPPLWKIWLTLLVPTRALNVLNIKTETDDRAVDFFYEISLNLLKQQNNRKSGRKGMLTEEELISQLFGSIMGVFETAATLLAFCCHELALQPDLQRRLYREVMEELPSMDETNAADWQSSHPVLKLPFLDAVMSETMRLHSPAIRPSRIPTKDYRLADTGLTLEKGLIVEIAAYGMQRSDEYFPLADKFIPDRFMTDNPQGIVPYTFIPFGTGPRACVGQKFSQLLMKLAIANLVRDYWLEPCARTRLPVPLRKYIRFKVCDSLYVSVQRRQ